MVNKTIYLSILALISHIIAVNAVYAQMATLSNSTTFSSVVVTHQDQNLLYSNRVEMTIGKKLVVKNVKGDINVIGINDSRELEIKVWQENDIRLLDRGNSSEAGVKVWTQDNEINVATIASSYNNRSKFSVAYRIEIRIPKDVQLYIDNQLGHITLDKFAGTLAIAASQGDIIITNTVGAENSRIKTFNGDISVANYTGHLMALCSMGDLNLTSVNANLRAKTENGDIDGTNLGGTIIFKVTAGDIDIEINELVKLINLTTIGGDIDVNMNTDQLFDIELAGSEINLRDRNKFNGSRNSRKVSGRIGIGGTPLVLSATGECNLTIRD